LGAILDRRVERSPCTSSRHVDLMAGWGCGCTLCIRRRVAVSRTSRTISSWQVDVMSSLRLDIQLVVIDTEYNEELKSVAQRGGSDVTQHLSTEHRNANTERTHACEESTPERSRTSQPPTFCRQTRGWDRR